MLIKEHEEKKRLVRMTPSPDDSILLNELRIKDESLTKEMYENPLDPDSVLNVLTKKLQLYNEIEFELSEARNKMLVGFMKIPVENRILITEIKKGMDENVAQIIKRFDALESIVKEKHNEKF
jgi:hypothetical protein